MRSGFEACMVAILRAGVGVRKDIDPTNRDMLRARAGGRDPACGLAVLAADAQHFGDAGDGLALFVEDCRLQLRIDLAGGVGLLLELRKQGGRHLETRAHPAPARLEELDGPALVPDDVPVAE